MSDNKTKRGAADRGKVAGGQSYEVDHVASQLQREFPAKSRREIEKAIVDSAKVKEFHNDRAMVTNSARLKLRSKN